MAIVAPLTIELQHINWNELDPSAYLISILLSFPPFFPDSMDIPEEGEDDGEGAGGEGGDGASASASGWVPYSALGSPPGEEEHRKRRRTKRRAARARRRRVEGATAIRERSASSSSSSAAGAAGGGESSSSSSSSSEGCDDGRTERYLRTKSQAQSLHLTFSPS